MKNILTSQLVERQVPSFIRDEYGVFVLFLKKYYEWLESNSNLSNKIQNLGSSLDVDLADDEFLNLIKNELAPYFPENILLDKSKFVKFSTQYYRSKGTPNSLKFLFRILFNEEIEIYYPKEDILKSSDGKWVLPLTIRVQTDDPKIFNLVGVKIIGETSQATALVENVIRSVDRQLGIEYVELFISNIQKLFATGEIISGVYLDDDGILQTVRSVLIGSLSEIKINPNFRGLFYNAYDTTTGYDGDPVTILGGLNPISGGTPIGAYATVGEVTKGSITQVEIKNGGFGFRPIEDGTDTSLVDFVGGFENVNLGQETRATISLIDENTTRIVNVSNVSIEMIGTTLTLDDVSNTYIDLANSGYSSNIENCVINLMTSTQSLTVHPISYVTTDGSGGGYRTKPRADFYSFYLEEYTDTQVITSSTAFKGTKNIIDNSQDLRTSFENGDIVRLFIPNRYEEIRKISNVDEHIISVEGSNFENDLSNLIVYKVLRRPINEVGALGRITIENGGDGYQVGEYITFTGGSGYGANAVITEVHLANNGIKTIEFNDDGSLIKGGEGYTQTELPILGVDTVSGANSIIYVTEILGKGVDVDLFTSRIGSISKLRVISYGYDYVNTPRISLRNADIVVKDVTEGQLFVSNTEIYQGDSIETSTFSATVESFDSISKKLRIFDYQGSINVAAELISNTDPIVTANIVSTLFYGDGKARASATFENGLIRYPGIYLNTDGQPSSDKKMQDGLKHHNFSYIIKTNNEYGNFKQTIRETVHPIGMKAFVTKLDDKIETIANVQINSNNIIAFTLSNTVNTFVDSNTIIATGDNPEFSTYVNVGDIIVVRSLERELTGTVNVTSSSNVVIGSDTEFINDLQDGSLIYISTGNTETVTTVSNSTYLITQNTIGVTSTGQTINVIYDSVKTVTFVNADTIMCDTDFDANSEFSTTIVQKQE
ncbi:MAG: hypothetical protein ACO295_00395 [Sediminibacterium sp.]